MRRSLDNYNSKEISTKKAKNDSSLASKEGEELLQKVLTIFKSSSDHDQLWNSINKQKNYLCIQDNFKSSEASRELQSLEDLVSKHADIQEYCQQERIQRIFKEKRAFHNCESPSQR